MVRRRYYSHRSRASSATRSNRDNSTFLAPSGVSSNWAFMSRRSSGLFTFHISNRIYILYKPSSHKRNSPPSTVKYPYFARARRGSVLVYLHSSVELENLRSEKPSRSAASHC